MAETPEFVRKQYIVDRAYQLRFVARLLIVVFTIAMGSSLIASAILWKSMYSTELEQQAHIVSGLVGIAMTLLVELLLSIPILYYLGIRQTHRVVGPLKRMTRALEAIGQGDFSQRLTLRKGDVLEDLAQTINRMAESLHKKFPSSK